MIKHDHSLYKKNNCVQIRNRSRLLPPCLKSIFSYRALTKKTLNQQTSLHAGLLWSYAAANSFIFIFISLLIKRVRYIYMIIWKQPLGENLHK